MSNCKKLCLLRGVSLFAGRAPSLSVQHARGDRAVRLQAMGNMAVHTSTQHQSYAKHNHPHPPSSSSTKDNTAEADANESEENSEPRKKSFSFGRFLSSLVVLSSIPLGLYHFSSSFRSFTDNLLNSESSSSSSSPRSVSSSSSSAVSAKPPAAPATNTTHKTEAAATTPAAKVATSAKVVSASPAPASAPAPAPAPVAASATPSSPTPSTSPSSSSSAASHAKHHAPAAHEVSTPEIARLREETRLQNEHDLQVLTKLHSDLEYLQHIHTALPTQDELKEEIDVLSLPPVLPPFVAEIDSTPSLSSFVFPSAPSYSSPPTTVAELQERIDAIALYKQEYERLMQLYIQQVTDEQRVVLIQQYEKQFNESDFFYSTVAPLSLAHLTDDLLETIALDVNQQKELMTQQLHHQQHKEWANKVETQLKYQKQQLQQEAAKRIDKQLNEVRELELLIINEKLNAIEEIQAELNELKKVVNKERQEHEKSEATHGLVNAILNLQEAYEKRNFTWFESEWKKLGELAKQDEELNKLVQDIPFSSLQSSFIPTAMLIDQFHSDYLSHARSAIYLPPKRNDVLAHLYASLLAAATLDEARVMSVPNRLTNTEEEKYEAQVERDCIHLSNASVYLRHHSLSSCLSELEQLSPLPRAQIEPWLQTMKFKQNMQQHMLSIRDRAGKLAQAHSKF